MFKQEKTSRISPSTKLIKNISSLHTYACLVQKMFRTISFILSSKRETTFLFSPLVQINKVQSPEQMIFLELF